MVLHCIYSVCPFFLSMSAYPDQPSEQRWLPVRLPREGIRWLPLCSHRASSCCDEFHWLMNPRKRVHQAPFSRYVYRGSPDTALLAVLLINEKSNLLCNHNLSVSFNHKTISFSCRWKYISRRSPFKTLELLFNCANNLLNWSHTHPVIRCKSGRKWTTNLSYWCVETFFFYYYFFQSVMHSPFALETGSNKINRKLCFWLFYVLSFEICVKHAPAERFQVEHNVVKIYSTDGLD